MSTTLNPDNSIAWVQIRLRGGWKNLLITGGAYALLVGGGIVMTTHLSTASASNVFGGWLPGLLGLQTAVLLLFGTSRVTAAIRGDHASRMIESHRLMPVGGGQAVIGYLVGATSQATILALVNFLLGLGVASGAGIPLSAWAVVNIVLAGFCLFVWVLAAFSAFLMRLPGVMMLILPLLLVWLSGGMLIAVVPALTVLISPLVGNTIFQFRANTTEFTPARAVSMLSQAFIAAVCFLGAGRRFRRGDQSALTPLLGLLLLGGWVAISCAGTAWWDDFRPAFIWGRWPNTEVQLVGSLLSALLLALTPVASLAREERDWRQRAPDDPRPGRRPLPGAALAALATLFILALVWVEAVGYGPVGYGRDDDTAWVRGLRHASFQSLLDPTLRTAAVVFLFLLACGYLLRILGRLGVRPVALFVIFLVLTWVGPLIGDVVRYSIADNRRDAVLGALSTLGPPGALIQTWVRPSELDQTMATDTTTGIAFQALLAAALALIYYRTRGKRPSKT